MGRTIEKPTKQQMYDEIRKGLTLAEISELFNMSVVTAHRLMMQYGLKGKRMMENESRKERNSKILSLLEKEPHTCVELANLTGSSTSAVGRFLSNLKRKGKAKSCKSMFKWSLCDDEPVKQPVIIRISAPKLDIGAAPQMGVLVEHSRLRV